MSFKKVIEKLDPEIYSKLKLALETGKWPDGRSLSPEQKEMTMRAIIAYEIQHDFPDEQRTGYVDSSGSSCHESPESSDQLNPLKWQ